MNNANDFVINDGVPAANITFKYQDLKDLAVNGKDLMSVGYKSGKELGVTLQRLLDCVIGEEINNNREELLELAKGWL